MFSIHRVELYPFDWLYLSPWESVVYAKRLELTYLDPIFPFFFGQQIGRRHGQSRRGGRRGGDHRALRAAVCLPVHRRDLLRAAVHFLYPPRQPVRLAGRGEGAAAMARVVAVRLSIHEDRAVHLHALPADRFRSTAPSSSIPTTRTTGRTSAITSRPTRTSSWSACPGIPPAPGGGRAVPAHPSRDRAVMPWARSRATSISPSIPAPPPAIR